MKDQDLLFLFDRIKEKDVLAYEKFYIEYYNLLYSVIFPIVKEKEVTEDTIHNTFLKIIQLPKEKFPTKKPFSWLCRVAKNEALQYIRTNKKEVHLNENVDIPYVDQEIENRISLNEYETIIEDLDLISQQIIGLKVLGDYTHKEISEILNIPMGTVQWKYNKALHKLRISLGSMVLMILNTLLGKHNYFLFSRVEIGFEESTNLNIIQKFIIELVNQPTFIFCFIITLILLANSLIFFIKHLKHKKINKSQQTDRSKSSYTMKGEK